MENLQNSASAPKPYTNDWAILYLRIIVGGALLLHNVAKMQDYNMIIQNYHQMWGVAGATWYVTFSFIEVLCAFLLIIGIWVRTAAVVLITGTVAGMMIYFGASSPQGVELNAIYILIYLLFVATGGGYFSFETAKYRRTLRRASEE
ncbi:MAG: DoxX family protein [Rikenellaceae bacterium]